MISETSLVQKSAVNYWIFIKVNPLTLFPREEPAVAPINDTEIAIMGGKTDEYCCEVIVFNTKTN